MEQQNKINSVFKIETEKSKLENKNLQKYPDISVDQTFHENQSMAPELVHEEMHRLRLENARLIEKLSERDHTIKNVESNFSKVSKARDEGI